MPFSPQIRTKVLLWCDRHCCLCKKPCGVNIEVHHIVPEESGGKSEIENAVALCFDCHSEVMRYNERHPKGNKFKPKELIARRDQVFEEFTRHLVPPIHYKITQNIPYGPDRSFPDVGFVLSHNGDSLPVRVLSKICLVLENDSLLPMRGQYSGDGYWNLNPGFVVSGHFQIPAGEYEEQTEIRLRVEVSIIDQYERRHDHLPIDYVYVRDRNYWYLAS